MVKQNTAVGFVGLGLMGLPMTLRLCSGKFNVSVWNRTEEKTSSALTAGAQLADTRAQLAKVSDIIFLCLTDASAVEETLFGKDSLASNASGKIIVDHSTIGPTAAKAFGERLHSIHGVGYIDAPVTGGVLGATEGTLTVFAGGDANAVQLVRPVLSLLARRVIHLGTHGAGQMAKLCNQVMIMNTFATMAEMIKLAENGGIDSSQIPNIFADGFAASRVLEVFGKRMAIRSSETTGHLSTARKDLELILDAGKANATDLPMSNTAHQLVERAIDGGLGSRDITNLIQVYD